MRAVQLRPFLVQEGGASLLSTIGSGSLAVDARTGLDDKDAESVVRELAQALARSVTALQVSRGNSREGSRDVSLERPAHASPKKSAVSALLSGDEDTSRRQHEEETDRCEGLVCDLMEQAGRRLRAIDRLKAEKGGGGARQ
jgi:hypothetical protein